MTRRGILLAIASVPLALRGYGQAPGLGQGVLGEMQAVASMLLQLAEAIPGDKYGWRPREGVQSVAEVFVHTATTNLYLLRHIGIEAPKGYELRPSLENAVSQKATAMEWLRVSTAALTQAYVGAGREERERELQLFQRPTTVEGVYIRALAHMNQHMGQAVAYARMLGVTPPWSA